MWCHLCSIDFSDFEAFKIHIIEKHRKERSESEESEHEISDQNNDYDSDNSMASENKSDDGVSPDKYYDSDHNVAAENNSGDKTLFIENSPKKDCDDEDNTCLLNTSSQKPKLRSNTARKSIADACVVNKSLKKLKKRNLQSNTTNKPGVSKKRKKHNLHSNAAKKSAVTKLSTIKKRVPKKKVSKKIFPQPRMSAVLDQEDSPSERNEVDHSQFLPSNNIVDPVIVSNVNSQPTANNNSVFLVNPYVGQGVNLNNYVVGNQAVQPPVYVVNTVVPDSTTSKTVKTFDFCSSNILKWLTKHKELCKNVPYPLPTSLFNQVKEVHKAIFDHYCTASASEETSAVLKVYEELDCMIHKHINSINNTLGIF